MIQIIGPRLSQWDDGRRLSISGSSATHVHLANRGDTHAVVMSLKDGEVTIPNYLLQTGKELCAYLVLDCITQESKTFPVQKREKPANYVYEDDRRNYIYELIKEAENAVKDAENAVKDAENAVERANKASENAENAGERANEAATKAESAVEDLDRAVLFTQQDLTAEQKANARQNIGAIGIGDYQDLDEEIRDLSRIVDEEIKTKSTLIVTVDENNTASHSSTQVYAHVQNGGDVVLDVNGYYIALSGACGASIYFAYTDEENISNVYELFGNKVHKLEEHYLTEEAFGRHVVKFVNGNAPDEYGNVELEPDEMYVYIIYNDDAWYTRANYQSALDFYNHNGHITIYIDADYVNTCLVTSIEFSELYNCMILHSDAGEFRWFQDDTIEKIADADNGGSVDLSNYYTKNESDSVYASKSYVHTEATRIAIQTVRSEVDTTLSISSKPADAKAVGDAIGNISSALDELHAYAEALKGGGAV